MTNLGSQLRHDIDGLDEQIADLILYRQDLAMCLTIWKNENDLPEIDEGRSQQVSDFYAQILGEGTGRDIANLITNGVE